MGTETPTETERSKETEGSEEIQHAQRSMEPERSTETERTTERSMETERSTENGKSTETERSTGHGKSTEPERSTETERSRSMETGRSAETERSTENERSMGNGKSMEMCELRKDSAQTDQHNHDNQLTDWKIEPKHIMALAQRYIMFGLGFIEMLFFGALVYGWANLVFVLKADGYYSDLCKNQTDNITFHQDSDTVPPTCAEQDALLNLVFTIGSFSVQGSVFFTGMLFDNLGTRFSRLLLHSLLLTGFIMMSFSSPSLPILLFPGMICISIGGIQLIIVNMQIGNLFGHRRSTVMTILSGCLDTSAFVMLLIKVGYEGGISLQVSFAILAGATTMFLINTFIFLPKRHIPWPLPPGWKLNKVKLNAEEDTKGPDVHNDEEINENEHDNTMDASRRLVEEHKNTNFPTLKSCILSPLFVLLFVWLAILQLRLLYFLGTLNPFLNQITDDNEELVSQYTTTFGYYQICGIFVAPFSGMILDRNKSKQGLLLPRGPHEDIRDSGLAFAVTTIFYIAFSIANVIPVLEVLYLTYLLHIITRGFMYALAVSAIPIFFPGKYFGTLYGLLFALSSLVGLLQFPLFIVSQQVYNNDPLVINLILAAACLITFVLPVYIRYYVRRKKEEDEIAAEKKKTDACKSVGDSVVIENKMVV